MKFRNVTQPKIAGKARKFQPVMKNNDPRRMQMGRFRNKKTPHIRTTNLSPMSDRHGNIKHDVRHFTDTFNGESAFLFAVNARLKGLTAVVSKVADPDGITFRYRVSLHKDQAYYNLPKSEHKKLKIKEKEIKGTVSKLDKSRLLHFNKRRKAPKTYDLEETCPKLYADLPKKEKEKAKVIYFS